MAKIAFDVSSQNPADSAGGNFKTPKPGVYSVVLKEVKAEKPDGKDRRLAITAEIKSGEFKGSRMWEYISLESEAVAWKLDQFLLACGIATTKKRKGSFDTDDVQGMTIKVRVKHETYNGEVRARIGAFLEGSDEDDEESDTDEDDEDLDDAENDESEDDEDEDDGEDDEDGGDDEDEDSSDDDEDSDDYDSWSVPDLRTELKERELSTKGGKAILVKRLRADDNGSAFDE